MSRSPSIEVMPDPIISSDLAVFSPSRSASRAVTPTVEGSGGQSVSHSGRPSVQTRMSPDLLSVVTEAEPLLGRQRKTKKPFYRARPLWLAPFAVTASVIRGMTLAPRVQVFTQLSCSALYDHHYNHTLSSNLSPYSALSIHNPSSLSHLYLDPAGPHLDQSSIQYLSGNSTIVIFEDDNGEEDDPTKTPSKRCLSDPAVQSRAARLQSMMTVIMGTLSALTTGWWGHFGEQHGRTRVLAFSTLGLFLTDLTFILVSTPHTPFSGHGHKLLIVAPFIEGLLGGWSTLQGATTAYISDCTSDGSRSHIFSRFTGVFYLGFSAGPVIGAFLIRHPIFTSIFNRAGPDAALHPVPSVTNVFWVAICCSFINLLLTLFIFPESLSADQKRQAREKNAAKKATDLAAGKAGGMVGFFRDFLKPLAVFLPQKTEVQPGQTRTNWDLTFLACALFGYFLATGIFQIKYLYAGHVYGWGAEQLSYYISFAGGSRAIHLLLVMPFVIALFKPKPKPAKSVPGTVASAPIAVKKSGKPTLSQLIHEISFDLVLVKVSFAMDVLSHVLVTLAPIDDTWASQAMFVGFSNISSFASGVVPAVQSLALCIMQVQAHGQPESDLSKTGSGQLFGAIASLQAAGQMILGPMIFATIYSETVAVFPKAIFTSAAGILVVALALMIMVRPAAELKARRKAKRARLDADVERGRSRVSKDISRPMWSEGLGSPSQSGSSL
ncbi:hypothetical protein OE88DRAFT_1665352 [Heliocybe sulcata]|uniref:MFS general substrate transporter n=1 Tax=Heliocybe sulcata TaxID=5364 RepID=A0A5C3MRT1_9AGAM|nr:hypothetical protein OE88DRAFT_1665352 [Heliocybe sulcata]